MPKYVKKRSPKTISQNVELISKKVKLMAKQIERVDMIPDKVNLLLRSQVSIIMRTWERIEEIANNVDKNNAEINERLKRLGI